MKYAQSALALVAIISVASMTSCTDRSKDAERGGMSGPATSDNESKSETYQQPGAIDKKAEVEKGHETIETRKETVTSETEKERVPTIEQKTAKIDVNRLSAEELTKLGLPKPTADNVVRYRKDNGNFKSAEDLKRVPGMDTAWLNQMQPQLGFSG